MNEVQLPEGVTQEMIDQFKAKHYGAVKMAELFDSEGTSFGHVIIGKPSASVIAQFERLVDRDPMKAREALVNGTLCTRKEEIKNWAKNSEEYAAVFDACSQMLPIGKAVLKNL